LQACAPNQLFNSCTCCRNLLPCPVTGSCNHRSISLNPFMRLQYFVFASCLTAHNNARTHVRVEKHTYIHVDTHTHKHKHTRAQSPLYHWTHAFVFLQSPLDHWTHACFYLQSPLDHWTHACIYSTSCLHRASPPTTTHAHTCASIHTRTYTWTHTQTRAITARSLNPCMRLLAITARSLNPCMRLVAITARYHWTHACVYSTLCLHRASPPTTTHAHTCA
jgi:hypothetical protein